MERKEIKKISKLFNGLEYIEPKSQYIGAYAELTSFDCAYPPTDLGNSVVQNNIILSASDCGNPHHPPEDDELLMCTDCGQPRVPPRPSPFFDKQAADCGCPAV